ncbi:exocyst complex component 8-like [Actinia tenebrosa]|uniref:Exocyst complex component 8 n=1 Tax=Actinia tenebrosa TaxID=6105 RepID=A0A6P8J3X7_ACTTE|nr:exocyst complex component 8-like [Actinia tenebrosa]
MTRRKTKMASEDLPSSSSLLQMFSTSSFSPEKYVHGLSSECDTDAELQEHRGQIQALSEETAIALKKNVYKNYIQFIETSKEISYLEAEMYQLSHLLAEQRALLSAQEELSLFEKQKTNSTSKPLKKEEKTSSSIEAVEGLSSILDVTDLQCIYEGSLLEVNPFSYQPKQKVHAFLLHDCMVIASSIPNRRGPVRYKFQSLYELENIAVVNVKNSEGVKDAFKILLFPETHIYQTENAQLKNEWLSNIEDCKKNFKLKLEQEVHDTTQDRRTSHQNSFSGYDNQLNPFNYDDDKNPFKDDDLNPFASSNGDLGNPFLDDENKGSNVDITPKPSATSTKSAKNEKNWLIDLPEDLDVCIAQRDFEKAMELIDKTNQFLKESSSSQALKEIKVRVDHRVKQLVEALIEELDCHQSILLHGGPRATRRAVSLLVRLGRASEACQLFLKNRSEAIKQSLRQLKIEGATALYITKLSNVFFTSLIETGKEFQKVFAGNSGFCSAFVMWANAELQNFVVRFSRQVFHRNIGLGAMGVCVGIASENCEKLNEIGLDLKFSIQHMLLKDLMEALFDCRDQLVAAARQRAVEELWHPQNFENLTTLICEMESCGIKDFNTLILGDNKVNLASATIAFTKSITGFLEDGLRVNTPELHSVLVECVADLFKNQVMQFEYTLKSSNFSGQRPFILKNAAFVLETVLPIVKKKLKRQTGHDPARINELESELPRLQSLSVK